MIIAGIVAVSSNGIIGKSGNIPWHQPADLKFFKKLTTGHHILMGRKTFQSIGKTLPNRVNMVLTRNPESLPDGPIGFKNIKDAIQYAKKQGETQLFIIGGAEIYRLASSYISKWYITEVEVDVEDGDASFDNLGKDWIEVSCTNFPPDEKNPLKMNFKEYKRL